MSYKVRTKVITRHTPFGPKRVRVAMGAYSDIPAQSPTGSCGPDQKYDPSFVFAQGMAPGQCVTEAQYNAYHGSSSGSSSSSGGGSFWDNLTAGLASALKPTGQTNTPVIVQGGGIGTGTMLAIGGGVVLLAVLLTRK